MFCHGARVGFYQGDISLLMDDIKTLKPTFFPVVPRLLNRIYDKVSRPLVTVNPAPVRRRFNPGFRFVPISTKDPEFGDLSAATGVASLRREEKAGRAQQWRRPQRQSVGQTGVQQDSGPFTGSSTLYPPGSCFATCSVGVTCVWSKPTGLFGNPPDGFSPRFVNPGLLICHCLYRYM